MRSFSFHSRFSREQVINNQPNIRILVVDDFADWRSCVLDMLQLNSSLQVVGIGSDGLEAVMRAKELRPDLILLDIGLPKLGDRDGSTNSPSRFRI
jgi:DNA-binding NarL/FixJ family response regulator